MTVLTSSLLTDRGAVSVTGPDAAKLLQGLVTNDIAGAKAGAAVFAGLLSPQGKIQFDFFVVPQADGFLIDVARDKAADLAKRLTLYRLRSAVEIKLQDELIVGAIWGGEVPSEVATTFRDPRLPELGWRTLSQADASLDAAGLAKGEHAYHAHRIALGVPEGGRDYPWGDAFPHEALFDQLHGVSFTKGCYVGQEIVSRMQHRGTARKRIVKIEGETQLPVTAAPITAGDVEIGTLGSTNDCAGLALVRLDRAAEFKAKGIPLMAGAVPLKLSKPAFATFELDPKSGAAPEA